MLIKYKGTTSALLKDLSLELRIPVDLKTSEEILKTFLGTIMNEISSDKSIELICSLPPSVKPFCVQGYISPSIEADLFTGQRKDRTFQAVMKVLEKYIQPDKLAHVYSCFPESIFAHTYPLKKQILQEVYKA